MSDYTRALHYAYLLLKYRLRSRYEIVSRLKQKKYSPALITRVVAYLEQNGYINDSQFASKYAAALYERGYGKRRVQLTLRRLGVADEDSRIAIARDDERERLNELTRRKITYYQGKKNSAAKVLRSLLARGFLYHDIMRAMEEQGFNRYED
ncbi:MAG: regulatory protein RecX [Candidatus Omnitrophota bacterium]|nr:recombination regulator RecX [Candidatus Omnitrophota bacterium]